MITASCIIKQFIKYAGIPVVSLESATLHPLRKPHRYHHHQRNGYSSFCLPAARCGAAEKTKDRSQPGRYT